MKNILKLSLAAMAVAALAACGGSGSSDAADAYVGTWKSRCYSYTGNDGNNYFTKITLNLSKTNATELSAVGTYDFAYFDSACSQTAGNITIGRNEKFNIGAKTSFLGRSVDALVVTDLNTGNTFPGYIAADSTQLLIVAVSADKVPTGWSSSSPFTKQ